MSPQTWQDTSNTELSKLIAKELNPALATTSSTFVNALRDPTAETLRKIVEDYRCTGSRQREGKNIADFLLKNHGIDHQEIANELLLNRTTIDRALNGESISRAYEHIIQRFHVELSAFKWPNDGERIVAGYSYAVDRLHTDILEMFGKRGGNTKPPMNDENFCFLWHMLRNPQWDSARGSGDRNARSAAATSVFHDVRDTQVFPRFPSVREKPPETLESIFKTWGLPFHLAVYSSVDVLNFFA